MEKVIARYAYVSLLLAIFSTSLFAASEKDGKERCIFSAETSRPESSIFALGEKVALSLSVNSISAASGDLKVGVSIVDEFDQELYKCELSVKPDEKGNWHGGIDLPSGRLGFYRVKLQLSNGVELPAVGLRRAGFLTYAIVTAPDKRPLYSDKETFFGMQGSISSAAVNLEAYLGVRWVLGGYNWKQLEPMKAGEFAQNRANASAQGKVLPGPAQENAQSKIIAGGLSKPWAVYRMPYIFFIPAWAEIPGTSAYCTGALTAQGEKAFREYCLAIGKAMKEDLPEMERHVCQITWEPHYPWGYKGTDEQLLRIYEIAYSALHEADPKAMVVGPTAGGIGEEMIAWHENLFKKGLGKYLDGFSIHPYCGNFPEKAGLIENIRTLRELIRHFAGKDLPSFGTEQGASTGPHSDPQKELDQAKGMIRANLIMMGEGYEFNMAFYANDYAGEPGYGYSYNLEPVGNCGTRRISPKPILPAYAAQSFLLEGHKTAGAIEWLGPTAWGYAYERVGSNVLALWDYGDKPSDVNIQVGVLQVEVFDWMGNARTVETNKGNIKLTLTQEPLYVKGVSPKLWGRSAEHPLYLQAGHIKAFPGSKVVVLGEVKAEGRDLHGRTLLEPDSRLGESLRVEREIALKAGQTQRIELPMDLPADLPCGAYMAKTILQDDAGNVLDVSGVAIMVQPPVAIKSIDPVFPCAGKYALKATLKEMEGRDGKMAVSVRIKGVPETTCRNICELHSNEEKAFLFDLGHPEVSSSHIYIAGIEVLTDKGYKFRQEMPVNFLCATQLSAPLPMDGGFEKWTKIPGVKLDNVAIRAQEHYHGPSDLSATLRFAWDENALYLACETTDDVFCQPYDGFDTWKGDCIQLGIDLDPRRQSKESGNVLADASAGLHRYTVLDFAMTKKGPEVFRTLSFDKDKLPIALLDEEKIKLVVQKKAGAKDNGLHYETAISWRELGLADSPKPGEMLGIAIAVNDKDSDAQTEPSAIGLFAIGDNWVQTPKKFGILVLGGD